MKVLMMKTFSIQDFFSKRFETESTNLLLADCSYFSSEAMEDYMSQIADYRLDDFISYMNNHPISSEITSRDITQLSSIEDCTTNMCSVMLSNDNSGLTLTEIARGLHADNNYKDNLVALTKYGENQVKTAAQLSLCIYKDELWFLTSVGYIFLNLNENIQNKYLAITLLRDPFYSKVISSLCDEDTCLTDFMGILSLSTQKRRSSSCARVMSFFFKQCIKEGVEIHKLISR